MHMPDFAINVEAGPNTPRVFVGTDENQILPFKVMKYTIEKYATGNPKVISLADVETPDFMIQAIASRTGFSFKRFAIPKLCGFSGHAIYVDADMQVFQPIEELWDMPMKGKGLLFTQQPRATYAVLKMNCNELRWNVDQICRDLENGRWSYDELLYGFAHMDENEKAQSIPKTWNDLDNYSPGKTRLIHYTDMTRQPWIYGHNRNGTLWYNALREALETGIIAEAEVAEQINLGHVSPELPRWIGLPIAGITRGASSWKAPYIRRMEEQQPGFIPSLKRRLKYSDTLLRYRDKGA